MLDIRKRSKAAPSARFAFGFRLPLGVGLVVLALSFGSLLLGAEAGAKKAHKKSTAGDDIFTNLVVLKLQVEIAPRDMAILGTMRRGAWRHNNNAARPEVQCTVREIVPGGRRVYTNVAVHLKGTAGSFREIDSNPALTFKFDKFAPGQTFHGLKKISLNNSVQDSSFLCERLSREMFLEAGQPVPRAGFATLQLNGTDWGMRVLLEGYDKQFLKRFFQDVSGNLYDGGFVHDFRTDLQVITGDHPEDHSDLRQLQAAMRTPQAQRFAALEKILDVDHFIRMVALEFLLVHWDGYSLNANNFRIYHDRDQDRLMFMPHGMDQIFGLRRYSPEMPILPQMVEIKGALSDSILKTPEGLASYLQAVTNLAARHFSVQKLTRRANELGACVREALAERSVLRASAYETQLGWLKQRIADRGRSLDQQIAYLSAIVKFDQNGVAQLSGWKPKVDRGNPTFAVIPPEHEADVLEVHATGFGSYRKRVMLMPGHYRFEGDVKVEDLVPEPNDVRGGASLHINFAENSRRLTGTTDGWVHYVHRFVIEDELMELELMCDARGKSGKATFNARSLKLIKE